MTSFLLRFREKDCSLFLCSDRYLSRVHRDATFSTSATGQCSNGPARLRAGNRRFSSKEPRARYLPARTSRVRAMHFFGRACEERSKTPAVSGRRCTIHRNTNFTLFESVIRKSQRLRARDNKSNSQLCTKRSIL